MGWTYLFPVCCRPYNSYLTPLLLFYMATTGIARIGKCHSFFSHCSRKFCDVSWCYCGAVYYCLCRCLRTLMSNWYWFLFIEWTSDLKSKYRFLSLVELAAWITIASIMLPYDSYLCVYDWWECDLLHYYCLLVLSLFKEHLIKSWYGILLRYRLARFYGWVCVLQKGL